MKSPEKWQINFPGYSIGLFETGVYRCAGSLHVGIRRCCECTIVHKDKTMMNEPLQIRTRFLLHWPSFALGGLVPLLISKLPSSHINPGGDF
ncbi:MAG: hypothetical protein ACK53K_10980 [Burkholderiales bacterium]